jgi:hypothetical protein
MEGSSIVDIGTVATAVPDSLLGAEVVAQDVCVRELTNHGFWVTRDQDDARVFVHPAEGSLITVRVGESVTVHGEVRRTTTPMERPLADRLTSAPAIARAIPYVYAYTVRPAWPKRSPAPAAAREQMCPQPH